MIIVGGNGKIDIDNILEVRLDLLKESVFFVMCKVLFGENFNCKFFD